MGWGGRAKPEKTHPTTTTTKPEGNHKYDLQKGLTDLGEEVEPEQLGGRELQLVAGPVRVQDAEEAVCFWVFVVGDRWVLMLMGGWVGGWTDGRREAVTHTSIHTRSNYAPCHVRKLLLLLLLRLLHTGAAAGAGAGAGALALAAPALGPRRRLLGRGREERRRRLSFHLCVNTVFIYTRKSAHQHPHPSTPTTKPNRDTHAPLFPTRAAPPPLPPPCTSSPTMPAPAPTAGPPLPPPRPARFSRFGSGC